MVRRDGGEERVVRRVVRVVVVRSDGGEEWCGVVRGAAEWCGVVRWCGVERW